MTFIHSENHENECLYSKSNYHNVGLKKRLFHEVPHSVMEMGYEKIEEKYDTQGVTLKVFASYIKILLAWIADSLARHLKMCTVFSLISAPTPIGTPSPFKDDL